jgi:hypothetical protein
VAETRQKMDERGCDRNVSIFALLLKHIAVEAKKKIDRKSTVQTMFQSKLPFVIAKFVFRTPALHI